MVMAQLLDAEMESQGDNAREEPSTRGVGSWRGAGFVAIAQESARGQEVRHVLPVTSCSSAARPWGTGNMTVRGIDE
jgi:hypothetical protein